MSFELKGFLSKRPWAAVALLMFIGVINYMDRTLPGILAEPLKRDLGLSDTFLGMVNGIAFLSVYALVGIPIARIADRGYYGAVITGALAVWSGMTALGGAAMNGWQLTVTRMGVAVGESGVTPASHAYISRYFPIERRGAALALLTTGAPIGAMIGMILGGLIGEALGWRMAMVILGGFGLLLSPLVLLALGTGNKIEAPRKAVGGDFKQLLRKPSLIALVAAASFIAMGGYSALAFAPAFLVRAHNFSIGEVGLQFGVLQGVVCAIAILASGWLGSRLAKRDPRLMLAVLAAMCLISTPVAAIAFTVSDPQVALVCAALGGVAATASIGLTIACLHSVVPITMRARASATMQLSSAVFGSLGPLIVGAISDRLHDGFGPMALGYALLLTPLVYVLATVCYFIAMQTFRRDQVQDAT